MTLPNQICISDDPQKFFPDTVQYIVLNNFEMIPSEERQILLEILYRTKLPVILLLEKYFLYSAIQFPCQFIIYSLVHHYIPVLCSRAETSFKR